MSILIINSGSSSLKFKLFTTKLQETASGIFDAINQPHSHYRIKFNQTPIQKQLPIKTHKQTFKLLTKILLENKIIPNLNSIKIIGHRYVHGGNTFSKPTIITPEILTQLKKLNHLAPLHNPANFIGVKTCKSIFKSATQIAVFDTAFHQTLPEHAYLYGLPLNLYKKFQIRRYGFHGINHKYVSIEATKLLREKKLPHEKLITCHLGNGASITAINKGKSIDTSMGYTPLEGLIMGTRSGNLDPAIPLILSKKLRFTPEKMLNFLNSKSGLKGISELSSDMRILLDNIQKYPLAKLAIKIYCYDIAKYISSYIAALKGVDAIIFTAGIGENAHYIRTEVCNYLTFLNFKLNQTQNRKNETFLTSSKSPVQILIIPANEELQIAKESLKTQKKA